MRCAAGNHGLSIHHHGLDICFLEYNYHESLRAPIIERIGHYALFVYTKTVNSVEGVL